jgi:uncharacterized protein (DUF488 family)
MVAGDRTSDPSGPIPGSPPVVFTIGHSTHTVDAFIALLRASGVARIADVRRFPASRRHPQFAREALASALADAGIAYEWLPELGGRRAPRANSPNTGWHNAGFRGYADYMGTEPFQLGIARLMDLARVEATAFMCAEQAWQQCHRGLIADCLKAAGWEVVHILPRGRTEPHPWTGPARIVDGAITYAPPASQGPGSQGALDLR